MLVSAKTESLTLADHYRISLSRNCVIIFGEDYALMGDSVSKYSVLVLLTRSKQFH